MKLGTLKRVTPRSVWPDEAKSFTPWLAEHIALLGEALGLELELAGREADVGNFSLDLLANDLGSGGKVVIENQFGATNHDHLGKILTYASGCDARSVIWVAETFREEHRQALDWLNQHTDEETAFFGVQLELLQIDASDPALNFKVVVFPNEWQKTSRKSAEAQVTERAEKYRAFFQALIDELREKHKFTNARVGQPQNWYAFTSGVAGFKYSCSFTFDDRVRVELYIDFGDADENAAALAWLRSQQVAIESEFGESLSWEPLEEKRACRVAVYRSGAIELTQELTAIREWAIEKLVRMRRVLGQRLAGYQVSSPASRPVG